MQTMIDVILPVFLVIGFGYVLSWRKIINDLHIDGVMRFATGVAVPVLLFRALSRLDLGADFDLLLLLSFYTGSTLSFIAGLLGARFLFKRDWEDAVAIGFCCLFTNALMLGLPITERAFGHDALTGNYAIVALHSPFCYGLGITAMEVARARGKSLRTVVPTVLKAMFSNALILGISLGFLVNISGLAVPNAISVAVDLVSDAALPTALFGMGGILFRYRPNGDLRTIAYVCVITLVLHPSIVWIMGNLTGIDRDGFRSAVLTAAMAPGINTYVFASMYGKAKAVAASSVLVATTVSILTLWLWLSLIP